jgi:phosphopantetheinyl transferase
VTVAEPARPPVPAGGPEVRLLDATEAGLDEPGLTAWARAESDRAAGLHCSRSYRYPYALIASHSEPVGVDIERIEPFDQAFLESIRTPSEPAKPPDNTDADIYLASLWSSKEALSKALGDALAYDPRRLESPIMWPHGTSGRWRAASLAVPAGHVGWVCWRD